MSYVRTPEMREKQSRAMKARAAQGLQAKGWKLSEKRRQQISEMAKQRTGEKNPFFDKKHSRETKIKISVANGGDGEISVEDRKRRKYLTAKKWVEEHPEEVRARDILLLETRAVNNQKRRANLRLAIIEKLGKRCSSSECRWLNEDGTLGCTDPRILCIDHVYGGGTKERNSSNVEAMWKKALADTEGKYQLLCYCCNWLKAIRNNEHNPHKKYGR